MKKIVMLCVVCSLLLSLCACGQGAGGQSGSAEQLTWQEQYDLGIRYLEDGNYEEAIIAFTAAIKIDPKRAPAYVGRGDAYVLSGETEENLTAAQADYEKAIELDEMLAEAYLGLADVYIRQGEYDKATEILKQGLEKTDGNQSIADKLSEIEKGTISDSSGKVRKMTSYDGEGNLIWWHEYDYNELGQQISQTTFDSSGNQTDYWDGFQYDEDGTCICNSVYLMDDGTTIGYSLLIYEGGDNIRTESYDLSGVLMDYQITEYNSEHNATKVYQYNANEELLSYYVYYYNNQQLSRITHYDANDACCGYETYDYDGSGNMIGWSYYNADGVLQKYSEYH